MLGYKQLHYIIMQLNCCFVIITEFVKPNWVSATIISFRVAGHDGRNDRQILASAKLILTTYLLTYSMEQSPS
jgi:hypothetical protein